MPVTLEVFANTGHQYFSFPLSDVASGGAKKKSGSELEALAVIAEGDLEAREVLPHRARLGVVLRRNGAVGAERSAPAGRRARRPEAPA